MPTQEQGTAPTGHARPGQRGATRRRADADAAPRHAAAPAPASSAGVRRALVSSAGVRGRPRDRSRPGPVVLVAAGVTVAALAVLGGRELLLDAPAATPGPRADASVEVAGVERAAAGSTRTPAETRVALERLLAGRAVALTRLLRATVSDDPQMASAAEVVLAGTTAEVGEVTRAWRGQSVAEELTAVLSAQSTAAVTHARALRDGDDAGAAQALTELAASSAALGTWLDRTTGGDVKALYPREDGGMLRAYTEAVLRGDRADADKYEQALQLRMSREGGTLATSVAGPAPVASFEQRQAVERWQLLFGRHAVLAGEVVRAEVTSADHANDASAALDANTRDVAALLGEALTPEQARTFADLWSAHVEAVVDHARAVAAGDGQQAATRLSGTAQAVGAFLGEVSGGALTGDGAGAALQQHATSLVQQADAWSDGGSAVQAYTSVIADHAALSTLGARTADALGAADSDS